MSNYDPLQDGDQLQGVTSSGGSQWRPGQLAPTKSKPESTPSDDTSEADRVVSVDTQEYGDCYDPTSTVRVRIAPWSMDTDHDGHLN